MRLGPIGEVASDPPSSSGTTSSGPEPATNDPSTVKSSGGSTNDSRLAEERRTAAVTSALDDSRGAVADKLASEAVSIGGQYSVQAVQVPTTASTSLSARTSPGSVATSTASTTASTSLSASTSSVLVTASALSTRAEMPRLRAMRTGDGHRPDPASKYCLKLGDNTVTGALAVGELVASKGKSLKNEDNSRGGGPPWVSVSLVGAPKSLVPIPTEYEIGRGLGAWIGVGPENGNST